MLDDLTKTFFDTFGIEPKTNQVYGIQLDYHIGEYPQITDRILLELIELLMKQQATEFYYHDDEYLFSSKLLGSNRPTCNRVNNLRELILRTAICLGSFTPLKDKMLPQIQALFKE